MSIFSWFCAAGGLLVCLAFLDALSDYIRAGTVDAHFSQCVYRDLTPTGHEGMIIIIG
jgi:hypothetical protein